MKTFSSKLLVAIVISIYINSVYGFDCPSELNDHVSNRYSGEELHRKILEKTATKMEILSIFNLQSEQDISNIINLLSRYKNDSWVTELLRSVWREDVHGCPSFSFQIIYSAPIKVSTAYALFRLDQDNSTEYIGYTREQLNSRNSRAVASAALSLGLIGGEQDVQPLRAVIVNGDIVSASSAVNALGILNLPGATKVLEDLLTSEEIGREKKSVIGQVLNGHVSSDKADIRL